MKHQWGRACSSRPVRSRGQKMRSTFVYCIEKEINLTQVEGQQLLGSSIWCNELIVHIKYVMNFAK